MALNIGYSPLQPNQALTIKQEDTLPIISNKYKVYGNGAYIRKGVLLPINANSSSDNDEEKMYLQYHNFKPIC